ncbi:MAG: hypothetical protein CMO55_24870 [Verrucomicrobiales bacterium]|nr:hypothetical protein [Verrucomicrobiales bacterium]
MEKLWVHILFLSFLVFLCGCKKEQLAQEARCRFLMPKEVERSTSGDKKQGDSMTLVRKTYSYETILPAETVLIEWDMEAGGKNPGVAVISCLEFGDPAVISLDDAQRKLLIDGELFRGTKNFRGFQTGLIHVTFCEEYTILERSRSALETELSDIRFTLDIGVSHQAEETEVGNQQQPH